MVFEIRSCCIGLHLPFQRFRYHGKEKSLGLPVYVHCQTDQIVCRIRPVPAGIQHRQHMGGAVGRDHLYIRKAQGADAGGLPDHVVGLSERDHMLCIGKVVPVLFQKAPVQPGDLVVLAIGVIISILGI